MTATEPVAIPFHRLALGEAELDAVRAVLTSGWLTQGPKTAEFEQAFARYLGARHAVAVSSCTAGMHLALEAIGLREGDEVLVPTTTFTATAAVVTYFGARPVLVDIDPRTLTLDPGDAARRLTPRTRAVLPVHLAGLPCDMEALGALARQHGLRVIEDAAHALPARYRGRTIGTVSDLTAFSFYATKTLTAGEGGMVTTDNPVWAERIRLQRLHGIRRTDGAQSHWRYQVVAPGYKYNLTDVQAALALVQLEKCDAHWAARRRIAERYTKAFGDVEGLETPAVPAEREPSWHLYIVQLDPSRLGFERDFLARALAARGIETSVHFIPLHLQPYYQRTFGYQTGDCPHAERAYRRCLSLPIYPALTEEEVERVIAAVHEVVRVHQKSRQIPSSPHAPSTLSETDQKAPAAVAELSRLPDSFYRRTGKRLLDVSLAAAGLLALSPLLALTALLVRLSSPGPILFRQERVGRGGRLLRLLKFRTMRAGAAPTKPDITCAGDGRITPAGSWLRRRKLDELPQLWNVLKGEMSLVGPRPELPRYVAGYTPAQRRVLSVRPGLTDPASVRYHNEEGLLARQSNPEQFYRTVVLPRKLALSLQYLEAMSLANDFRLLGRTLKTVLFQPLPSARRRLSGGVRSNGQGGKTRAVGIDELLKRPPLRPAASDPLARAAYGGKRILVTGAAGSIGSELVRQLAELAPACLLLVDKDENSLHERQLELARHPHPVPLELQVADIRFRTRLARILERFRPQVVFHAAAHKHVPLMEACAAEAVTNNVFGTVLLADLALRFAAERFVLVSTDKAVDPEGVMGMSKRVAELAVQARAGRQPTRFCCVRFGNVVASRSSVIPLFERQIAAGGPLTLTHPESRRYFMTIPQAAALVLHAGALDEDGATYVLDMGEPVSIADLAHELIARAGLRPEKDIRIDTIGLRPGERVAEKLVGEGESLLPTRLPEIYRVQNGGPPAAQPLAALLDALRTAAEEDDDARVRALLRELCRPRKPRREAPRRLAQAEFLPPGQL